MLLEGIYAPIPTPFVQGEIAYPQLAENLAKWSRTSLAGLVVMGSNGEAVFLEEREKVELTAFVSSHTDKMVVAGTGCESTRATVRLTVAAARSGAQAALVINPHYYRGGMSDKALIGFYTEVADNSPIPVIMYNMPSNTGVNIPAAVVAQAAAHPNIIGIKDSSGDIVQMAEIVAAAPDDFAVFAGSGGYLLPALAVGARGGTCAVANILPEECARVVRLFREGRLEEARIVQQRILPVNRAVTARWGVAGLKTAMDMLGWFGGEVRPPLLALGPVEREELRRILDHFRAAPA